MKELNSNKKIGKARYALTKSKSSIVVMIIFMLFVLVLPAGLIIQMFEDDYSDVAIIGFSVLSAFFSLATFSIISVIPVCLSKWQKHLAKGNSNIYDLFMQFPLTKKQILVKAFRNWVLASIIPIVTVIAMCIIPMFYERANELNSQLGLIVILTILVLASVEAMTILTTNSKIRNSMSFKVSYFVSFYIIFMFFVTCGDKLWFLNNIGVFEIFSGIVGVVILLAFIPIMWIITKILIIDVKGKEAWHYEKIK